MAHRYNPEWAKQINVIFIPFLDDSHVLEIPSPDKYVFTYHGGEGTVHYLKPGDPQPSPPKTYSEIEDMMYTWLGHNPFVMPQIDETYWINCEMTYAEAVKHHIDTVLGHCGDDIFGIDIDRPTVY